MSNFFKDNADLRYYFERGVDWAPVVELVERGFTDPDGHKDTAAAVDFYTDIAETVGGFVAAEVAPKAAQIDREGMGYADGEVVFPKTLTALFKKIQRLELNGMALPRELGGLNVPGIVYQITNELFARGDVSVCAHNGFHGGMAMAALLYSLNEGTTRVDETGRITETRFREMIDDILAGKAWGSMDLTEPGAGSDLGAIRSTATLGDDGIWRISGEKIFITSGHAKWHFVIARSEPLPGADAGPGAGLAGLSMYLVKAFDEPKKGEKVRYARFERIEEKLGHHGSATVAVTYDESPAELIGQRGEGFKQMLFLMNNARIGVGFESIGLMEAATRLAREYAEQRPSMGKTIDRHEMIADYLDEMESDIEGIRAIVMRAAWHEELSQRNRLARDNYAERGTEAWKTHNREHHKHKAQARRLTPLLKYLGAEKAVEHARRCVQIHGGVGYTREYGAEKLLRDAMVMPIYEGTSQIQALMAMKDALVGIIAEPQAFVAAISRARWRSLSARDGLEKRVARMESLMLSAQQHLMQKTATDKLRALGGRPIAEWPERFLKNWDPKRDFAYAMLHAERLCRLMADVAICKTLWHQASRHADRRAVLARYLERAEPRARHLHDVITTTGDRMLASLAEPGATEAAG